MPLHRIPGLTLDRAHPLSVGLVDWWLIGEGAGSGLNDTVNPVGGRATITGPAWTGGGDGAAMLGDGTNGHASVSGWSRITGNMDYTVSAWVYPGALTDRTSLVCWGTASNFALMELCNRGTNWGVIHWNGDLTWTNTTYVQNVWQHIVLTRTKDREELWVNGESKGAKTTSTFVFPASTTLRIGKSTSVTSTLIGRMKNVRIYSRSMKDTEPGWLYREPLAGLSPRGLTRYFVPPRPVVPPPVVTATGGVNYNQARQAWIRREDEELIIIHGRHP